jgi:hypothetical protein
LENNSIKWKEAQTKTPLQAMFYKILLYHCLKKMHFPGVDQLFAAGGTKISLPGKNAMEMYIKR